MILAGLDDVMDTKIRSVLSWKIGKKDSKSWKKGQEWSWS